MEKKTSDSVYYVSASSAAKYFYLLLYFPLLFFLFPLHRNFKIHKFDGDHVVIFNKLCLSLLFAFVCYRLNGHSVIYKFL